MPFTTLITSAELAAELTSSAPIVIDCRFDLANVEWGRNEYLARHIPGAAYAHLDRDLSGAKTGTNGRHPLPDPEALKTTFSRLGIGRDVQVVAYDEGSGMYASRLWWLLRWMGHDAVAVLDGGFGKWSAEERPTATGDEQHSPREFTGSPRANATVDANTVARLARDREWKVIDARAPERYRGEVEPLDRVAGHIPGAVNRFYKKNLDDAGVFLDPGDLRRAFGEVVEGASPEHIVCYCGSGVTACHNLLALEHAGLHGAKLYPGSWSEWSSDSSRAVGRFMNLVWPAAEHLPSYIRALEQGWSPDNMRPEAGPEELEHIAHDPAGFIAAQVDREASGPPIVMPDGSTVPRLPGYHLWMWDGEFCGEISFRWKPGTTELPPTCLGHIGYSVVPWKRLKGYATRALRGMLVEARKEGLPFVELTTNLDNIASQRVILANGGKLVERFQKVAAHGGTMGLRYRIWFGDMEEES